jgi:CubicO group peptidase (beta-lactamase class C family)
MDHDERIDRIENSLQLEQGLYANARERGTLSDRMDFYATPGLCITVVDQGKIAWTKGYGTKEAGRSDPVTTETRFQAGSISKVITAIAVLRLAQDGRFDLHADVNAYLTSWKVPSNGGWQPRITIAQLLSHRASTTVDYHIGYGANQRLPTTVEILDGAGPANTPPVIVDSIPGLDRRYSGGGFTILEQMLVDVVGMPFPQIMRQLVLEPLEMVNSSFEQPMGADWSAHAATAHPYGGVPLRGRWHLYPELASVGLWTTTADLARCIIDIQLSSSTDQGKILSSETVKEMMTEPSLGCGIEGRGTPYRRFREVGWNLGFLSNFVGYLESGYGAVVMYNSTQSHTLLTSEVMRAIAHEYEWPRRLGSCEDQREPCGPDTRTCDGEYELQPGVTATVTASTEGCGIVLSVPGQQPIDFYPAAGGKYTAKAINMAVRFQEDKPGEVTGLAFMESGRQVRFAKRM